VACAGQSADPGRRRRRQRIAARGRAFEGVEWRTVTVEEGGEVMASNPKRLFTPEEYLEIERKAEYKSEYIDGEIFAMAGASQVHNVIAGNIFALLHPQSRKKGCRVYISDMRVDLSKYGMYSYPDIAVVCDQPKFSDKHKDNLVNPVLIIEVLSDSTEAYDRGEKFMRYRKLLTFSEYVLVSQPNHYAEHYVRQANKQWLMSEVNSLRKSIHLSAIDYDLRMSAIYETIEFES
jgi:Uma2 family endonuclease